MIELNNNKKNWKTTKEVAKGLGIATTTIRRFLNDNKQLFKGLIMRSSEERSLASGGNLLWSPESVKILIKELPTVAEDWKNSIKDEFMEKGIVYQ